MDDKLPKCGCTGEPRRIRNDRVGLPHVVYRVRCTKCFISTLDYGAQREADAAWTRAISAQTPGMEAMREALRVIADDLRIPPWIATIATAALQAAERVKV